MVLVDSYCNKTLPKSRRQTVIDGFSRYRWTIFFHEKISPIKYYFSKLDDSGNCIIRKTCCIVFDLKRNGRLSEVIPHGRRSVNCCLGLQHFSECHAYEYSQRNKSLGKVLAHL